MLDLWELASIATRFALYLGVLTAVGTFLTTLLLPITGYRRFAVGFALLGIAATVMGFSLSGAALTGDAGGMVDFEMLGLLWSTSVGTAVALRLAGLGLLIVGLLLGRVGRILSMIGGGLALWSFVTVGHIPDRGSLLLSIALLFHLVAISIWIGVLTPLRSLALDPSRLSDAVRVGHRFGKIAAVFVPLLILAGVYMSYELVGSLSSLVGTGYGQALIIKVLFVASLLVLAAANKLRFIPQMSRGDPTAAGHLSKSISIEWAVIVIVILTTAALTSVLTLPS